MYFKLPKGTEKEDVAEQEEEEEEEDDPERLTPDPEPYLAVPQGGEDWDASADAKDKANEVINLF